MSSDTQVVTRKPSKTVHGARGRDVRRVHNDSPMASRPGSRVAQRPRTGSGAAVVLMRMSPLRRLRPGVGRIGSTPTSVLVLIALLIIVAKLAILLLEEAKPETKRQPSKKEVHMNARLIVSSVLETAWAVGVNAIAGAFPPPP